MIETRRYWTFVLQGWLEEVETGKPTWRFRLHDVHSDTARGFTNLEAVVIHIHAALEQVVGANDAPPPPAS